MGDATDLTDTAGLRARMREMKNENVITESLHITKEDLERAALLKINDPNFKKTLIGKFCPPSTQNDPETGKPIGHPCVRCCSPNHSRYNECKDDGIRNTCKNEYNFEELSHVEPMDIARENLELRLSDNDFLAKVGMSKDEYKSLAGWKKKNVKKTLKIFGGSRKFKKNRKTIIKHRHRRKSRRRKKSKYRRK